MADVERSMPSSWDPIWLLLFFNSLAAMLGAAMRPRSRPTCRQTYCQHSHNRCGQGRVTGQGGTKGLVLILWASASKGCHASAQYATSALS